jgi:hypothetical protein
MLLLANKLILSRAPTQQKLWNFSNYNTMETLINAHPQLETRALEKV